MEKVFIKTVEAITSVRKKFSVFVTTDRSFTQSVMMACYFIQAKFILFNHYQRLEYSVVTFCKSTEYRIIL